MQTNLFGLPRTIHITVTASRTETVSLTIRAGYQVVPAKPGEYPGPKHPLDDEEEVALDINGSYSGIFFYFSTIFLGIFQNL